MKDILERIKTDKDYRFDFIIAVWSGIIIIGVLIGLICGIIFVSGKVNKEPEPVATEAPTEAPTTSPSPTPFEDGEEDYDEYVDEDTETYDEESVDDVNGSNDTVYATTTVNVRADATTESASLGKITAGTSVERIENMDNGWSKVLYNGQTAYIKSEYLSMSPVSASNNTSVTATKAPASNSSPVKTKAPSSTSSSAKKTATPKPKATTVPADTQDDDEISEATTAPVKAEPTSVPPVSDNFTGTESVNMPDSTTQNP